MKQVEVKYAPGMRIIVRGEEWLVKKVETNSLENQTLHVIGLSQLVKDYESMFLVDIEDDIEIVDPAKVTLVPDNSAFFRKSKVYIESQWRGKIPTDNKMHIGNKAAMDLMSYQLEPAQMALNKTNDMKRCMQNDLAETAWPATQYLWKLHPIFNWIEDKAGIFYKRSEVPVLGLTNSIGAEDILFIVAGLIPNRKSTTVVDEWFGVLYKNAQFDNILSMSEVLQKTHLNVKVPNTQNVSEEQIARGQKLLGDVVNRAKKIMADKCAEYKEKTDPYIYEEMERLEQLEQRHKDAQLSFFDLGIPGMERKKSEKEREIEAIFTNFMDWEKDTLEIEENPYIRIIAVVTGVR